MFGIEVWPKKLESIQVARYLPGDNYGNHVTMIRASPH